MSSTSVLIVDDHAVVRKGLRLMIESQIDMCVVGEAATLQEAISVAAGVHPDVITLDLSMPGPSGIASVDRLRTAAPASRILIVTMHDDPAFVRSAVAMGASGFVSKSAADTELIAAIRSVSRGRVFIDSPDSTSLGSILGPRPGGAKQRPIDSLSERELEVLRNVARGHTNQQIADQVGLSVKTVESYRARLMKKLNLKDRTDLVRLAIDSGLL